MARPKSLEKMSVADLQREIAERKGRVKELKKQERKLLKQLAKVQAEIERAGGGAVGRRAGGGGVRPRNEMSLADAIAEVLKSGKPMKVGDVTDAVLKLGYKSSSPKFSAIVNQTLIKDNRFEAVERGVYRIK